VGRSGGQPSDYVCPWCGAPLSDSGATTEPGDARGPARTILTCSGCGARMEGPPGRHTLASGWKSVLLTAILGLVLAGLAVVLANGSSDVGSSLLLPRDFTLPLGVIGVVLCLLAAFALRDQLHGRRQVRYWRQHRRAQ